MKKPPLAPRELFEKMLEYMPIPTFDLIIECDYKKIIVVRRKIAPYKGVWALPGLRMYKGETIDDTLIRIAKHEIGLDINPNNKRLLGQYVGKFTTENMRQDISTCYVINVKKVTEVKLNENHFTSYKITESIPKPIGAMYKHYLELYFQK